MFSSVWQKFKADLGAPTMSPAQRQQEAVAVLLHEVAHADLQENALELDQVMQELSQSFGLSREEAERLRNDAADTADRTVSLYKLVETLNQSLDVEGKRELLARLWRVALADGVLDPHEEALIRKLSELLFVPHAVFVQERLRALGELP
jgi:uncharacterized tellurite resistance protein B-like protein